MLGSALNSTLAARLVSSYWIVLVANYCMVIGSIGIVVLTFFGTLQQESFAALAALSIFGCGLLAPNVAHDALQPMGRRAGVASAAPRSMQMLFAAVASALVGLLYDGQTAFALGGMMTCFAILGLLAQMTMLRGRHRSHELEVDAE